MFFCLKGRVKVGSDPVFPHFFYFWVIFNQSSNSKPSLKVFNPRNISLAPLSSLLPFLKTPQSDPTRGGVHSAPDVGCCGLTSTGGWGGGMCRAQGRFLQRWSSNFKKRFYFSWFCFLRFYLGFYFVWKLLYDLLPFKLSKSYFPNISSKNQKLCCEHVDCEQGKARKRFPESRSGPLRVSRQFSHRCHLVPEAHLGKNIKYFINVSWNQQV